MQGSKDMIYQRSGSILISIFYLIFRFNQKLTCGRFRLVDTPSGGSPFWSVGLKGDRTDLIRLYPFTLSDLLGSLDLDPTNKINGGEKLTGAG
jgi:hypothetical protein